MAESPRPKRKRQEDEEEAAAATRDGTGASVPPFPLAQLRLRRVLRESARDKTMFLHGEVLGGEAGPGQGAAAAFPRRGGATAPPRPPGGGGGAMGAACPLPTCPVLQSATRVPSPGLEPPGGSAVAGRAVGPGLQSGIFVVDGSSGISWKEDAGSGAASASGHRVGGQGGSELGTLGAWLGQEHWVNPFALPSVCSVRPCLGPYPWADACAHLCPLPCPPVAQSAALW